MCLAHRSKPSQIDSRPRRRINSPGSNGRRALATRLFLRTVLRIFSVAPPTGIMAATTSFSSAPSRPMDTTVRNPCCFIAADMAGLPHDQEGPAQAGSCEAETAVAGRSPQGVCCQGDRILRRGGSWRRDPRSGAPSRRDPTAIVSLLSEQGRPDQGSLPQGLFGTARYRLGEVAGRPVPADPCPVAGIL